MNRNKKSGKRIHSQQTATPDASPPPAGWPGKRNGAMDGYVRAGQQPTDCDAGCVATSGRMAGKRSRAMDGLRRVKQLACAA